MSCHAAAGEGGSKQRDSAAFALHLCSVISGGIALPDAKLSGALQGLCFAKMYRPFIFNGLFKNQKHG